MSRNISILIIFLFLLSVVSCGKNNSVKNKETVINENINEGTSENKKPSIATKSTMEKSESEKLTSDQEMLSDIKESMENIDKINIFDKDEASKAMSEESKNIGKHGKITGAKLDLESAKEAVFGWYNLVEPGMTVEEVENITKVKGLETEAYYGTVVVIFRDPDSNKALSVGVNEGERIIRTKQANYTSITQLSIFTPGNHIKEQADQIKNGMTYEEVKNIMGVDGAEITKYIDENVGSMKGCIWANEDGTYVQVNFDLKTNRVNFVYFNEKGF